MCEQGEDEIAEVCRIRHEISAACNHDVNQYFAYLRSVQDEMKRSGEFRFAEIAVPEPVEAPPLSDEDLIALAVETFAQLDCEEETNATQSRTNRQMKTLGLLGGVASGKSLVSRQLAAMGALILNADRAGHEALRMPEIEAAARERWDDAIFDGDGHIDRSQLAKIVFAPPPNGPRERKYLETLTHPEIGRRLAAQVEEGKDLAPLIVVDAALLFEAGWDKLCDCTVFVDAPRAARLARALQRGWTEEDFTAREGAQDSLDSKRARAGWIIDNSGSVEDTEAQVKRLWQSLVR